MTKVKFNKIEDPIYSTVYEVVKDGRTIGNLELHDKDAMNWVLEFDKPQDGFYGQSFSGSFERVTDQISEKFN